MIEQGSFGFQLFDHVVILFEEFLASIDSFADSLHVNFVRKVLSACQIGDEF